MGTITFASSGIEVGKPFPKLVLPALDNGFPHSVEDWRGTRLVLHIWASW